MRMRGTARTVTIVLASVLGLAVMPTSAHALPNLEVSKVSAPAVPLTPDTPAPGDRCPTTVPAGTLRDGSESIGAERLCRRAVRAAATPQARRAIRVAFTMLGAPYACAGVGRNRPYRFDCSSLVGRAYYIGAGIPLAGRRWAISTRDLAPWDGRALSPWVRRVQPENIRPGDLVVYDTGGLLYRHVVMYLGDGYMLDTNSCGDVAHVRRFWGFITTDSVSFMVARRVITPGPGTPIPVDLTRSPAADATTVSFSALMAGDPDATIRVQVAFNRLLKLGFLVDGIWDGRTRTGFPSFRRWIWGWSTDEASGPPDRPTLEALGERTGFTVID